MPVVDDIREACERVALRSEHVSIDLDALKRYARELPADGHRAELDPEIHFLDGSEEDRAAFVLTLDAINFGSGWFPTLRKREGRSGYETIALGLRERFARWGRWRAPELIVIGRGEVASVVGQDRDHELVGLFAESLNHLGARIADEYAGSFSAVAERTGSAADLVDELAGWAWYADVSPYGGDTVPFYKRAQITVSDLALAGVAEFEDLDRLTMFADNVVPHVLRLDGVLRYSEELAARIDSGELLVHNSAEEVEIRACALYAVELIVTAHGRITAQELDHLLWTRGREARYKDVPRHRSRCTAY